MQNVMTQTLGKFQDPTEQSKVDQGRQSVLDWRRVRMGGKELIAVTDDFNAHCVTDHSPTIPELCT